MAITPILLGASPQAAQHTDAAQRAAQPVVHRGPYKPAPPLHPTPQDIVDINRVLKDLAVILPPVKKA